MTRTTTTNRPVRGCRKAAAAKLARMAEEERQADAAIKSAGGSGKGSAKSRRGFTNGFADPLKKYEGSYKSPPAPTPEPAKVTAPVNPQYAPARGKDRTFRFADWPDFRPNLSPAEVMQLGSFGGTYFRKIFSAAAGQAYSEAHAEFPAAWWKGLKKHQLCSKTYDTGLNRYGVACGGSLDMWESSGWINATDPYGWFQWYCRFFQGRRTSDDARQISRWCKSAGPKGRFRNQLIGKCSYAGRSFDDASISPVIRQTLQHWGYQLTQADLERYCKLKGLAITHK
eukprot:g1645.t1